MNERHASGYAPDYDAYGYDAYSSGSYPTVGTGIAYEQYGDPYAQSGGYDPYEQTTAGGGQDYAYGYGYATGYGTGQDQTGTYALYDPYAYGGGTGAGAATGQSAGVQQQAAGTPYYETGTYDASAWTGVVPQQQTGTHTGHEPQQDWDSGGYPVYGQGYGYGYGYDASGDTGMFEQVAYAAGPGTGYEQDLTAEFGAHSGGHTGYEPQSAQDPSTALMDPVTDTGLAAEADPATDFTAFTAFPDDLAHDGAPEDIEVRHDYAADGPAGDDGMAARSRRRKPAKRSALLTIAVPSVAVMGVAAVGAAAVGGVGVAQGSNKAQADGPDAAATTATGNAPTTQLDRQLSGVSRQADDFATRASRTQERIDLKDRQAAAAKARAEVAARAEALRPKFVLPVTQKGLSAYFGQAGEHWMMLHTGIDFPVQVGTPVMAATDGTVRTQWNPSYGNMAIVTAPDGTETWYCHLSSTKIRSGKVQAGTVIAYSGNTGNTTGPHLHFEVRPGGGSPIDPLPWLLAHGLDPR